MKTLKTSFVLFNVVFWCLYLRVLSQELLYDENSPIVELSNGKVRGFTVHLENTGVANETRIKRADIFLAIPYAQPPIDKLRLEKPKPALNWTGILEAKEFAPACVPLHLLGALEYSEDCLYLNVFRPSGYERSRQKTFPVLVFIHGGGFSLGGNFVEGFQNISNNFVSRGVIVITIQYRLGLFGFFSDGSKELPGNLGIWDQNMALKWVNKNIGYFDGDPNRVTLWGQSAGSASVSFHAISPKSRDLFQQTIEQSGNFISKWALNDRVINTSHSAALEMNCDFKDSALLKQCLKNISLETILYGLTNMDLVRNDFEILIFNPRMDGDFFEFIPEALTKLAPPKPSLIGFNTDESIFAAIEYPDTIFAFESPLTILNWKSFDKMSLITFINEKIHTINAKTKITKAKLDSFCKELIAFYVESDWETKPPNGTHNPYQVKRDYRFYLQRYVSILTDIQFLIPTVWEARLKSRNGWPVYIYQFDYINPTLIKKLPFRGIVHGSEYPFTFGIHTFGFFDFGNREWNLRNKFINGLANFVKNGIPITNGIVWPLLKTNPKSTSEKLKLIRFGTTERSPVVIDTEPEWLMIRVRFWDKLSRTYDFSKIKGVPHVHTIN